jgi:hypothetical protein
MNKKISLYVMDDIAKMKRLDAKMDRTTDPVQKLTYEKQIATIKGKVDLEFDDRIADIARVKADYLDRHPNGENSARYKALSARVEHIDERRLRIEKKLDD